MRLGEPASSAADLLPARTRPDGVNATTFVHSYLKALILDLVLPPDTLITEMDVAKATGLSRTPIREALLRLHEERLVEIFPRRGALVPKITARQVRELYELRLLLETHAAESICQQHLETTGRLLELCDRQERMDAAGASVPDLIRVDREFHAGLMAAAGNSVITAMYTSLGDHFQRTGVLSFSLDRGRSATAVADHREIALALQRFDLSAALAGLERHLRHRPETFLQMVPD